MSLWRLVEGKYCHQVVICRNFGPIYIIGDFLFNSFPSSYHSNNNQTSVAPIPSASSNVIGSSALTSTSSLVITSPSNLTDLKECSGSRKARVLYDYDAANSTELSLLADEVITVFSVVGMDSDWLMGERGNQKGRVPITYLELLN